MTAAATQHRRDTGSGTSPFETAGAAAVAGVVAVLVAVAAGAVLAGLLIALGLTTTSWWSLTTWLAGTGLLGGWEQSVTATVAGGVQWSSWVAGAPMAVTLAVMLAVAVPARRRRGTPLVGSAGAAAGAAVGAVILVMLSGAGSETTNAAGTVAVQEGLTFLWTGGLRPGTVLGAALLIGGAWWVNTAGFDWWRQGRAVAYGLLIVPGLVLTLVAGGAVVYLTSSPAVGIATVALFPLLGTTVILVAAGAPADVGVTRVTPEPLFVWTWSNGLLVGVAGLLVALLIAVGVGLVLRRRGHAGDWAAGLTAPAAVAGFICWATGTSVVVPEALGGPSLLSVHPIAAMIAAAGMAALCLAVRGSGGRAVPTQPVSDSSR